MLGPVAERLEHPGETLLRTAGFPVPQGQLLDRGIDGCGVQPEAIEGGDLGRERADMDVVAATTQLEQGLHQRVEVPAGR